jgi:hypothetical protein
MKGDLWLAVGDETGNWDDTALPKQFLGVALVLAKVPDWKSAMREYVNDETVFQRMKQPLQNLPPKSASKIHHVIDALRYFSKKSVQGVWTLEKRVEEKTQVDRLRNDLFWTKKCSMLLQIWVPPWLL